MRNLSIPSVVSDKRKKKAPEGRRIAARFSGNSLSPRENACANIIIRNVA